MTWQQRYLERYYPPSSGWTDGTSEFHGMCAGAIAQGSEILEIGAGPTNATSAFLRSLGPLTGLDVSASVHANAHLDRAFVIEGEQYPFADESFDACVSNYVLEHVGSPGDHFREVARVLRPGGAYLFRTPNLYHYTTVVSRFTPHAFHRLVANRLRGLDDDSDAPYPTVYAANSARSVMELAESAGLEVAELRMVEKEPTYGLSARPLFLAFTAYERVVNSTPRLAPLRANIFACVRKPRGAGGASVPDASEPRGR